MAERRPYPTDLLDAERELIAPLVPERKPGGRSTSGRRLSTRWRAECARMPPRGLPSWKTGYHYWRIWHRQGR